MGDQAKTAGIPQSMQGRFANFGEAQRRELWAALALKHTNGLGNVRCGRLLQEFKSAYAAVLQVNSWGKCGIAEDLVNEFRKEEWRTPARQEWDKIVGVNPHILLWTNPYYPQLLRNTPQPPLFLYYRGNVELLSNPGIGVVGARNSSPDGLAASYRVGRKLSASGVTVISGLARGVDKEAHEGALEGPGSTIAVLGSGLDVYYPRENRKLQEAIAQKGLLLSEYPHGTEPEAYYFPVRNRIISALSFGILVVEAAAKSGSLITARLALEYGREVFAIPGKFAADTAQGCHSLIRKGAKPVLDVEDVLLELNAKLEDYIVARKDILEQGNEEKEAPVESIAHIDEPLREPPADSFGGYEYEKVIDFRVKSAKVNSSKARGKGCIKDKSDKGDRGDRAEKSGKAEKRHSSKEGAGPFYAKTSESSLDAKIINLLKLQGTLQFESICAQLSLPAGKVSSELLLLEVGGKVKRYPGMIYSLQ